MNDFIESALKLFCSSGSLLEESVIFERFEKNQRNTGKDGFNAETNFGHIVYKRANDDPENISPPLMLKTMRKVCFVKECTLRQFYNEIAFFTRAFPILQKIGPIREMLPRFYDSHTRINHKYDDFLLIFENLQPRGFRTADRFSFLDLDHLSLMVRKLGNFHSYSYRAKCQSHLVQEFQVMAKWFYNTPVMYLKFVPNIRGRYCYRGLQRLGQSGERYVDRLRNVEKLIEDAEDFVRKINTTEHENAMSVLCHGDYTRGNVLFRYESQQNEEKPVDLKMIDMACCKVGSPVIDLGMVLYLNADQNMRNRHWDTLIDTYYSGLCELFGREGVPSKDDILNEFRTKAFCAYIVASYFLPTLIAVDQGKKVLFELLPPEYAKCNLNEVPIEILDEMYATVGGEEGTEALVQILKDMIDRGFI